MLTIEEKKERKRISNKKHWANWYSIKENRKRHIERSGKWYTTPNGKKWKEKHPYIKKLFPLEVRFWKNVLKKSDKMCWEWQGAKLPTGYGKFSKTYAHRYSYKIHKGELPFGLHVCHSCDNPSCVNPNHLWIGTVADKMRDRDKKGRGRKGKKYT